MQPLVVIDVVGLTPALIGEHTPNIAKVGAHGFLAPMRDSLPAVTCTAQTDMLTGVLPREHGIVANGWYFRDLNDVFLWRQSATLAEAPRVWDLAKRRDPAFTVANLFWWFNMNSTADVGLTPRPIYKADGRKLPGIYGWPPDFGALADERLGPFPLFKFWGPAAGIESTRWIASSALLALERYDPTLLLVYLPHLDYGLQRTGPLHPSVPQELRAVDAEVGRIVGAAERTGRQTLIVSEYGIEPVQRPISINRELRRKGLLEIAPNDGDELLDFGRSRAFAVADHQIAHVYVRNPDDLSLVRRALEGIDGIESIWGDAEKALRGLDHPRSGELVCLAERGAWFTYYYWLDDALAPDFARTVDIHRKPGYDPVELFLDPRKSLVKARIVAKLLKKKLGFRTLMDLISLDPTLVKGSHGRPAASPSEGPVLIHSDKARQRPSFATTDVASVILESVFQA